MKTLIPPLAVALLILTLVSCQNDITTQPPPKTGGDTTMILSIDTLTDTVSMPLCRKISGGSLPKDSLFIRNDSMYKIIQEFIKRETMCKDYIFSEVNFSQYDLLWMRHSIGDNYKSRYTLIRNDSTKEYISIAEGYRHIDSINSDAFGYTYKYLYRVPKIQNDYTVKFVFQETLLQ
jgi:hypothetical protein